MTTERIVYRVVVRSPRDRAFLPAHGIGAGLDEPRLGIVLNRVVTGPTRFRTLHKTVIGVVITEDEDHITVWRSDGEHIRIPTANIIERSVVQ